MSTFSYFEDRPSQQWSNEIRPRPSTQTDTRVSASPLPSAPRTLSVEPIKVIPVRCKCQPNAFRLRIPVKPQADATPRQGNWREQFKRVLRCLAVPAFFNWFGLRRPMVFSLLNSSQEPSSGIRNAFKILLWLVGLHADQSDREVRAACAKNQIIRSKKL